MAKIESLALGIKSVLIKFPEQELFSVTVYVIKKNRLKKNRKPADACRIKLSVVIIIDQS